MKPASYLLALCAFVFFWISIFGFMSLGVDPYGVSPVNVSVHRINEVKIRRLDIDRLIKPYEVWRYQPETVFLGTSRIHQSINPATLDGSAYARAYNASIPASSLSLNISHLQQYLDLNPNLKTVFVELFIYNFLGQGQDQREKGLWEFLTNSASLFVSGDVLWDALITLGYNVADGSPRYEIKPGGYFYYPPGHDARGTFAGFPGGIWAMAPQGAESMKLHQPAIETVRQLQALADERGVTMIFIATPNHAYFDYFVEKVGAWPTVERWLEEVASIGRVISYSQPNSFVYEPVSQHMSYWNDPFHFSLGMGDVMIESYLGLPNAAPENFMVELTPDMVGQHIAARRRGIQEWAAENSDYVERLEQARLEAIH